MPTLIRSDGRVGLGRWSPKTLVLVGLGLQGWSQVLRGGMTGLEICSRRRRCVPIGHTNC